MKTYTLSEETLNAILGYLGNGPYTQVAPIITRITQEIGTPLPTTPLTEDTDPE